MKPAIPFLGFPLIMVFASTISAQPAAKEIDLQKLAPRCGVPKGTDGVSAVADFQSLPNEHQTKWLKLVMQATDERLDGQDFVRFMQVIGVRMRILFDEKGKAKADVSKKMLARLDSLKSDDVKLWHNAYKKLEQENRLPIHDVAVVLLPVDQLFNSDKYVSDQAKQPLQRLNQLPKEVVDRWCEKLPAFKGANARLDAAMTIVLLDQFFDAEKFNKAAFDKALDQVK